MTPLRTSVMDRVGVTTTRTTRAVRNHEVSMWSDDGRRLPLDPHRWHGEPSPLEQRLVAGLDGPVLDVGCGPGRILTALSRLGVAALGVDPAPGAVGLARRRGARVLQRSVFDPLPGHGGWRSVLLLDGNIGIGGDPVRLLRRCRELADREGTIIAEVEAPGQPTQRCRARLVPGPGHPSWFQWAVVGVDAIVPLAVEAALRVARVSHDAVEQRWFAHLAILEMDDGGT